MVVLAFFRGLQVSSLFPMNSPPAGMLHVRDVPEWPGVVDQRANLQKMRRSLSVAAYGDVFFLGQFTNWPRTTKTAFIGFGGDRSTR